MVPARDEADTIGECLKSLVEQDYPGKFRIVIVDDSSRDGTGDVARGVATEAARSITIVSGAPLEPGWTGKLWALNQGIRAALNDGEPEFLWFTDADIAHGSGTLRALVAKAETDNRDLVSLMVRLHCSTVWEKLLVPAFVFFFQKLYPFAAINDPARKTAGAAGGCLLVRRSSLAAAGGIEAIRGRLIDDCALAEVVQTAGGRLWLGLADDSHSLRPYTRLGDVWDMVARTAFTQLDYSWMKLAGTVVGMVLIYLLPPLGVLGLALSWQRIGRNFCRYRLGNDGDFLCADIGLLWSAADCRRSFLTPGRCVIHRHDRLFRMATLARKGRKMEGSPLSISRSKAVTVKSAVTRTS